MEMDYQDDMPTADELEQWVEDLLSVLGLDLLYVIWFSGAATAAPNQRTEGVSENNDDKVVRQFELL
ncbi:unnamed protein product [Boreogadus saida]